MLIMPTERQTDRQTDRAEQTRPGEWFKLESDAERCSWEKRQDCCMIFNNLTGRIAHIHKYTHRYFNNLRKLLLLLLLFQLLFYR